LCRALPDMPKSIEQALLLAIESQCQLSVYKLGNSASFLL